MSESDTNTQIDKSITNMSDNNTEDTQAAVIGGTPTSSEHYHRFLCFVEGPPIDKDFYINKNSTDIPQSSLSSISGGITTISDTRFGGTAQQNDIESGSTDTFDVLYGRSERYTEDNRSSLSSLTDIAPSNDRGRFHFGRKGKRFETQLDDIEDSPPRPLSGSPWYIQSQQAVQPPPIHSLGQVGPSDIPKKKLITSRSHLDEIIIGQPPPVPPLQQNRLPSFNNRRISCESTAGISEGFLTYVQEEIRNTYRKRRMLLASVFVIFFICIIAITAAALTQNNNGEDEGNTNASFQVVEQQPQEHNTTGLDMTNDEGYDLTLLDISDAVSAFDEAVSSSNEDMSEPNIDVVVTTTVQTTVPSLELVDNDNQVGDADAEVTVTNPTTISESLLSNEMNEAIEPSSPATAEAESSSNVETSIGQTSTLATTSSKKTTTKPPSNPDWLQQISVFASLDPPSVSPTPKTTTAKPSSSPSFPPSTSPTTKAPSTNSPTMSPTKNKCISKCEKESNDQYRKDRDALVEECMEKDAKKCDKDEKKCKRDCKRDADKKEQEIMEKINSDELKCKTTCLNNNSDDTQLTIGRDSNVLVYQTDRSTPDEFWMNMNP